MVLWSRFRCEGYIENPLSRRQDCIRWNWQSYWTSDLGGVEERSSLGRSPNLGGSISNPCQNRPPQIRTSVHQVPELTHQRYNFKTPATHGVLFAEGVSSAPMADLPTSGHTPHMPAVPSGARLYAPHLNMGRCRCAVGTLQKGSSVLISFYLPSTSSLVSKTSHMYLGECFY
jgi:hypothetical protein